MALRDSILPIDVFEEVVDQAGDDSTALRHLSLTCSEFLPRARYHLFRGIQIKTVRQLDLSHEFINSRPWLPPLVQRVTLNCMYVTKHVSPRDFPYWMLDVVPVHLLCRLPNLFVWRIGPGARGDKFQWVRLSLHRSTLSCYRRYSIHIQHLELSHIRFDHMSDFTGLVSAFAGIQSLICSHVFVVKKEDNYNLETNSQVARSLPIKMLQVDIGDTCVAEYLLACSAAMVNDLTIIFMDGRGPNIDRLEEWTSRLSQLSALTLVIKDRSVPREDHNLLQAICYTTRILEHVERARLSDVWVEFELDAIATLGCWLSKGASILLEACIALEEALLTFEAPSRVMILFRHPWPYRRAGRVEFWSPTIKRAFPRLHDQGFLAFTPSTDAPDTLGHERAVTSLVASPDSKWIATASDDGTIVVWSAECGTIVQEWVAHQGHSVNALAFSPDSRRLVSAGSGTTGTLAVWDISHAGVHQAAALEGHTDDVTTCAWSLDGTLVASASKDGTVRVWDAQTFQQRDLLEDAEAISNPEMLQFSPDAAYLACRCRSCRCCTIWRPLAEEQPKPLLPSWHPSGRVFDTNAFSFDPESGRIATVHGTYNGEPEHYVVRIWDIATGATLAVLAGHSKRVSDVSFAPDGRFVLSASEDGSTKIWDTDSWEETGSLEEEGSEFVTVKACFSPDGKYIATASSQMAAPVRLWRAGDASCLAVFTEHTATIEYIVFSPDGKFLASGDGDGIVHIRRVPSFTP